MEKSNKKTVTLVSLVLEYDGGRPQFIFNLRPIVSHQAAAQLLADILKAAAENDPTLNVAEIIEQAKDQLNCPSLFPGNKNRRIPIISALEDPGTFNRLYEIDLPNGLTLEQTAEIMLCLYMAARTKNPDIKLEELGDAFIEQLRTSNYRNYVTKGPPQ